MCVGVRFSKIICIFLFLRGLIGWLVGVFSEGSLSTALRLPASIHYVVLITWGRCKAWD